MNDNELLEDLEPTLNEALLVEGGLSKEDPSLEDGTKKDDPLLTPTRPSGDAATKEEGKY